MGGFADLDNDCDLDLVFPGFSGCYLNDGNGTFQSGPTILYEYPTLTDPRSVAFADINNDGDLDFVVADKESNSRVIRNDLDNANNWLKINLVSPDGQAGAFGTKVFIYPEGQVGGQLLGFREARSNSGFSAQDDPVIHFGLGSHISVDVAVMYLDGTMETRYNVSSNDIIDIMPSTWGIALNGPGIQWYGH